MSDPRDQFPEEVWHMILDRACDPQNILSCSNTCALFRNHFSPTRTTWGFPLIFPSLRKFLSRDDALQCRLVAKGWLKGVDNFLQSDNFAPILLKQPRSHNRNLNNITIVTRFPKNQLRPFNQARGIVPEIQFPQRLVPNHPNFDEHLDHNYLERFHQLALMELEIQNGDENRPYFGRGRGRGRLPAPAPEIPDPYQSEFLKFMSSFGNNNEKNPFPSRAVILLVTDMTIQSTDQFLNKFGDHIWSLALVLRMSEMGRFQELQLIWKILSRTPNLKHLLIDELPGHFNVTFTFQAQIENEAEKFSNFLDRTTTPVLKQLKWMELNIKCSNIEDILVRALSGKSVTIFERDGYIRPSHLTTDGWKHLHLQLNRQVQSQSTNRDWKRHIRSFKLLNLPLKSINLQYYICKDFESIFDALSKYESTLCCLKLTFNKLRTQELIKMKNQVDSIYFSFLSKMKCLDSFNMVLDCDSSGCTLKFCQFVHKILNAEWIENYLEMGGVVSGFRRSGFACISAGLKMNAAGGGWSGSSQRKYFKDGKHFRSMEVTSTEEK